MKKCFIKKCSILAAIAALSAFLLLLSGCTSNKLADIYDEDEVKAKAEEVVALANAGDYETLASMFPEELKASITAETFEAAWSEKLTECGEFVEFSKEVILGQKQKDTGEDLAVAVLVAKYENGKAQFTLSFAKQDGEEESGEDTPTPLSLVGAYMK